MDVVTHAQSIAQIKVVSKWLPFNDKCKIKYTLVLILFLDSPTSFTVILKVPV